MTRTTQERIASFPKRVVVDLRGLHSDTPYGIVDPGSPGYTPLHAHGKTIEQLDEICAGLNATRKPTPAERTAAQFGSMFGWHLPGADPENYDDGGRYAEASAVGETARDNVEGMAP